MGKSDGRIESETPPAPREARHRSATFVAALPGLAVALVVAGAAALLGQLAPIIGGPVFGILLGVLAAAGIRPLRAERMTAGYRAAGTFVLQASIVVLGTGLSLGEVARVGATSLPVMLGTLAVALGGAALAGRALGLDADTRTLIGVGTGICGASAIAAASAAIKPKDSDVAYAIGTIFTFNIAAVLLFPPLGHLLGLSAHSFGLWSGTAVNDTSSVVAAAESYGGGASSYAIVVKLTRSLMIIPIVTALVALRTKREQAAEGGTRSRLPWRRMVPAFIIGFVLAAALDTVGAVPASWHPGLSALGTFLVTIALAGIGLNLRISEMRKAGARPLLLGGVLWAAVGLTSLGLQAVTGTL
ncbi:YeiH family protein [Sinomonas humi]|uniref:Membrane protein YeiH n=1 Tax=Sinomonas humi TaxID=1338436 RepID=A0A0B2ADY2_9MICC|nr:putative sulfate exporter family transporter [Sinomonas humi]KHL01425.1 membrane protein YeiH [Sinomonas humi]